MAHNGKKIVIGVDGGGTKTQAVLYREGGEILADGRFPSTNPHVVGRAQLLETLGAMMETLAIQSGIPQEQVDGICLGMAGCDSPSDKEYLESAVRQQIGPDMQMLTVNDAVVALVAAVGKLHGLLLISGTGAICFGANDRTGTHARTGGFGHILADEGSGYTMGLAALKAVMQEFDGRGEKTSLTPRILGQLGLKVPLDLMEWTYLGGNGKTEIAALSIIVHEEATAGDSAASAILDSEAHELMRLVAPTYRKVFGDGDCETESLVLWGGNLVNSEGYRRRLTDLVTKSGLPLETVVSGERAVIGAAIHMLNHLK